MKKTTHGALSESWSRAWVLGSFCPGIRLGGLLRLAAFSAGMTESRRDASPLVKKSEDVAGAAPVPGAPDARWAAATKNDCDIS